MTGHGHNEAYRAISVTPCCPQIGAEIGNIDLTRPLTDLELAELRRAFTENLVLFFRDQKISFEDHVRLGEYFGPLGAHVGSKTISKTTDASMYEAYDALSDRMKTHLEGLTALHDGTRVFGEGTPKSNHPVIARHPESGRKLIYVNCEFTTRINDVPEEESAALLSYLIDHCARPEWSYRFRWQPHSIAFWDNRCTHHMAVSDYLPAVRSGYRVQVEGSAPPVAA